MDSKIIVLEGLDGSGKQTQAKRLIDKLSIDHDTFTIDFPRYGHASSALMVEHLQGRTSTEPTKENPYAVSSYAACDRFISYQTEWKDKIRDGTVCVFDRYSTSNMIYQASKLPREERPGFMEWVMDYEYGKLGLPSPSKVIYLDVHPDVTRRLMAERYAKNGGSPDALESDVEYQLKCREAAMMAVDLYGWSCIACSPAGALLSIDEIHALIISEISGLI